MIDDANGRFESTRRKEKIAALATMLDYAIFESTDLRLPLVGYLLEMARMELIESAEADVPEGEETPPAVF